MILRKYEFQTVYQPAGKTEERNKNFTFGATLAIGANKFNECLKNVF